MNLIRLIKFIYYLTIILTPSMFAQLKIVEAFPNLAFDNIVDIQSPSNDTDRMYIVSQRGVIHTFENDISVNQAGVFLDIRQKVLYGGEQGLLGLAFHPDYQNNGFFYVNYTTGNPRRTVISRFKVSEENINEADPASEVIILEVEQPYSNHNGGQIAFGPDGYLYVSFGDGGSGGDPDNNGQNLRTLLGSIIRIDVDNTSGELNYSIPLDNPFADNNQDYREEIYAYGLRNVWRFSFDIDGNLWAGDVGQNAWEEVHIIESGDNCGWRVMEGFHCYNPSSGCDTTGLAMPVWEYDHSSAGGRSITGGYVSQSHNAGELFGKYICADFLSGRFWGLSYMNGEIESEVIAETNYMVSTFGVDNSGELYFADYKDDGKIYKFEGTPITTVKKIGTYEFRLLHNYPNPFNPETIISYKIGKAGYVKIEIFNAAGERVLIPVSEYKAPGLHEFTFNARGLGSGIYYYRLITGKFTESRKMIYLK